MQKNSILMSLMMMAALLTAIPAFAQMNRNGAPMMNQQEQNSMSRGNQMSQSPFTHSIDLSYLLHKSVKNEQGRTIGKVSDVIVGPNGQAEFVILSRTGLFTSSGRYLPVPWKTFSSHWTNSAQIDESKPVVLSLSQDRINRAPGFSNKKDLTNNLARQKVCMYFKGDCQQSSLNQQTVQ